MAGLHEVSCFEEGGSVRCGEARTDVQTQTQTHTHTCVHTYNIQRVIYPEGQATHTRAHLGEGLRGVLLGGLGGSIQGQRGHLLLGLPRRGRAERRLLVLLVEVQAALLPRLGPTRLLVLLVTQPLETEAILVLHALLGPRLLAPLGGGLPWRARRAVSVWRIVIG
jgi:hypothetical protein